MVENMRAQAARWDTHGRAWVIYGIPNPTQTRKQCSVKKVSDTLSIHIDHDSPKFLGEDFVSGSNIKIK